MSTIITIGAIPGIRAYQKLIYLSVILVSYNPPANTIPTIEITNMYIKLTTEATLPESVKEDAKCDNTGMFIQNNMYNKNVDRKSVV